MTVRFMHVDFKDIMKRENEIIDEKTEEKAKEQSNIKIMAQEVQEVRAINQKVKNIVVLSPFPFAVSY